MNYLLLFSDKEALSPPHQAADERLHGLLPHGEEAYHRAAARHSQRWGVQGLGKEVEGADKRGPGAVHPGGGAAAAAPHAAVPGLQVPAEEEVEAQEPNLGKQPGEVSRQEESRADTRQTAADCPGLCPGHIQDISNIFSYY